MTLHSVPTDAVITDDCIRLLTGDQLNLLALSDRMEGATLDDRIDSLTVLQVVDDTGKIMEGYTYRNVQHAQNPHVTTWVYRPITRKPVGTARTHPAGIDIGTVDPEKLNDVDVAFVLTTNVETGICDVAGFKRNEGYSVIFRVHRSVPAPVEEVTEAAEVVS